MLLATAGTAALVMVVVTSVRAARRRLRYESWHLLHLYAYLGVGLALPHQLWTGTDFVASPAARAYWWTLYAVALGAVLVFRLGLPLCRTLRHRLVVVRVVEEAPGVVSVYLRGRRLDRLPAQAGQFFVWRFLDGPGWTAATRTRCRPRRTRTDAADHREGPRRRQPPAGRRCGPGTRVLVEGPYGALTADRRTRPGATLLASGIGITPLRALLEELPARRATLVYRARTRPTWSCAPRSSALAAARGVRVVYLLGPRAADGRGCPRSWRHVGDAEALRQLVPDIAEQDVFVCGPGGLDRRRPGRAGRGRRAGRARCTSNASPSDRRRRTARAQDRGRPAGTVSGLSCCSATTRRWPAPARAVPADAAPADRRGRQHRGRAASSTRSAARPRRPPYTGDTVADPVGPGAGADHRRAAARSPTSPRCSTRTATAATRRSTPTRCRCWPRRRWPRRAPTSTRQRRDRHQRRLRAVAAVRARPGEPVTAAGVAAPARGAEPPRLGRADDGDAGQHPPARRRAAAVAEADARVQAVVRRAARGRRAVLALPAGQRGQPDRPRRARPRRRAPAGRARSSRCARRRAVLTGGCVRRLAAGDGAGRAARLRPDRAGQGLGGAAGRRAPRRPVSAATSASTPAATSPSGRAPTPQPWRIGIEDPADPARVLAVAAADHAAGSRPPAPPHRGPHLVDPRNGRAAAAVSSVTVVGPSLLWADVLATAAFVRGPVAAWTWSRALPGYEALVVAADGALATTSGLARPR